MINSAKLGTTPILVVGALLTIFGAQTAAAQDEVEITGNVALTTNYVFRGISQTDDGPAIQGGFDLGADIFYAGAWASSVDFGDDTTMELDVYAGISPEFNGMTFDLGVIYYGYPDSPELATGSQDFLEIYGGVSHEFNQVSLGASLAYSPDFYGETGGAFYAKGEIGVQVTDEVSISGHYGQSAFEDDLLNDDYGDYSVGATVSAFGLDFDLRYHGTVDMAAGDSDAVVFTVSREF